MNSKSKKVVPLTKFIQEEKLVGEAGGRGWAGTFSLEYVWLGMPTGPAGEASQPSEKEVNKGVKVEVRFLGFTRSASRWT